MQPLLNASKAWQSILVGSLKSENHLKYIQKVTEVSWAKN